MARFWDIPRGWGPAVAVSNKEAHHSFKATVFFVLTITGITGDAYYSVAAADGCSPNHSKIKNKKINPAQTPAGYPNYDMAEQVQTGDGLYHLADDTRGGNSGYSLPEEINPDNRVQNEDEYQLADSSGEDYANFDSIQR